MTQFVKFVPSALNMAGQLTGVQALTGIGNALQQDPTQNVFVQSALARGMVQPPGQSAPERSSLEDEADDETPLLNQEQREESEQQIAAEQDKQEKDVESLRQARESSKKLREQYLENQLQQQRASDNAQELDLDRLREEAKQDLQNMQFRLSGRVPQNEQQIEPVREQAEQLIQRAERPGEDEQQRIRFNQFAYGLLASATGLGIKLNTDDLEIVDYIKNAYTIWREGKLPQAPEDDKEKIQFFERNGLPPQCQRRIYTDASGKIRSVVICTGYNRSDRIYHDR